MINCYQFLNTPIISVFTFSSFHLFIADDMTFHRLGAIFPILSILNGQKSIKRGNQYRI